MTLITSRRTFLGGLAAALFAPAIVRATNIMPVRALRPAAPAGWLPCDGRVLSRANYAALYDVLAANFPRAEQEAVCVPHVLAGAVLVGVQSTPPSLISVDYRINASDPRLPIGQIMPFFGGSS